MNRTALDPDTSRLTRLVFTNDHIDDYEPVGATPPAGSPTVDGEYLAPGMIDLQINGLAGVNFGDPTLGVDDVRRAAGTLWETGCTHFLPTLITNHVDTMAAALRRLATAAEEPDLAPSLVGFHLEGPYLSSEDGPRGAHPLEHVKDPDWDEFQRLQEAAGGRVRLVTLAPERTGAVRFIEKATAAGVRIAIGHTAANRAQIQDAVAAGACMSTHLGNAAHDRLQRHHNYIYDQLGDDRLAASLIVDGHHLPPHLVDIFQRVKGWERTILVSDAVQYAGLPPGVYDGGYRQFEVRVDGFIGVLGEPRMAGAGLLLLPGVENLVKFIGCPLGRALGTVTRVPAKLLGLNHRLGELAPGREASFIRFHWDDAARRITLRETVLAGRTVYAAA
ncbi:MAG: N-acetylglucosamine-6-phosphate deacetylase [Planctomycetia bacterium]